MAAGGPAGRRIAAGAAVSVVRARAGILSAALVPGRGRRRRGRRRGGRRAATDVRAADLWRGEILDGRAGETRHLIHRNARGLDGHGDDGAVRELDLEGPLLG